MQVLAGEKLEKKSQRRDQRIIFEILAQMLKRFYLYIKMIFQFFRLDFSHNLSAK
jgi:hypothetical protein